MKWSWNGDGPAYGSPIVVELDGTRQIITCTQENIVGVSAATGELLWKKPLTTRLSQNAITPVVYGDTVIVAGSETALWGGRMPNAGKTEHLRFTAIWMKQRGRWQEVVRHRVADVVVREHLVRGLEQLVTVEHQALHVSGVADGDRPPQPTACSAGRRHAQIAASPCSTQPWPAIA